MERFPIEVRVHPLVCEGCGKRARRRVLQATLQMKSLYEESFYEATSTKLPKGWVLVETSEHAFEYCPRCAELMAAAVEGRR